MSTKRFCLAALLVVVQSCGARSSDPNADSQGHWLKQCDENADCGAAACLCGVCSGQCELDSDCWALGDSLGSRCVEVSVQGCSDLPEPASICVPDCPGGDCVSVDEGQSGSTSSSTTDDGALDSETVELASRLRFEEFDVPKCPSVASRVSLPLVSPIADSDYEGIVSVESIAEDTTGSRVTLVFSERAGGQATLVFRGQPNLLASGARYTAFVRGYEQGSENYAFITLRDDTGKLLLAANSGRDTVYQQGSFQTPELFGATVTLRMSCQDAISGGCFENQVQADYDVEVSADQTVVSDGAEYLDVTIDGAPYLLSADASSVDGGARRSDCNPEITPGRYLHFAIVAQ